MTRIDPSPAGDQVSTRHPGPDAPDHRLAELSPAKRALLEQRMATLRLGPSGDGRPRPIARDDSQVRAPLSFGQERLWLLERFADRRALYNVSRVLEIDGRFERSALQAAVDAVVARHEVLRTVIEEVGGVPTQVIRPELRVLVEDVRSGVAEVAEVAMPAGVAGVAGRAIHAGGSAPDEISAFVRRPFELDREAPLRVGVIDLDSGCSRLVVVTHHLASDDASKAVLFRDLSDAYSQALRLPGAPIMLSAPTPAVRYVDFASWQREELSGSRLQDLVDECTSVLAGAPPVLELPTDRPRPASMSWNGDRVERVLAPHVIDSLGALARARATTPFQVALSAFTCLLARLAGVEDVVVGTPVAGRSVPEVEGVIGFFTNMVVVRAPVDLDAPFTGMIERTGEVMARALAHQELPFEKLVEALNPGRDLSHTPVFQIAFMAEDSRSLAVEFGDAAARVVRFHNGLSKYDLTVVLVQRSDGWRTVWEYSSDLYDRSTVERWAGHFEVLLGAALENPGLEVGALPLHTAAERRAVIGAVSDTTVVPVLSLTEQFEAVVDRRPDAIAVTSRGSSLTYRELDVRAEALARVLLARGVGADDLIGVCVERSVDLPVALLGVLKAGAAYVPIDPGFPHERIRWMLEDATPPVVVTHTTLLDRLPDHGAHELCLDRDADVPEVRLAPDGTDRLRVPVGADALGYTIFTSGSTGRPKGVQVPRRCLANFLASMATTPGLAADDVLLAVTTLSFDISGLELLLPLLQGARVVIATTEEAMDGRLLRRLLVDEAITVMQATPATWRMLVDTGWSDDGNLRMLCGGEALPPALAQQLLELGGELWNMYGPTETTIWSSCERVSSGAPITLGRPIADTQLYVLDRRGEPAPVGVAGELCIGGAGVALGYLDRPELTAERFVPDPYAAPESVGARLYRTGDLARLRADGRMEFLGRLDHQVKIRGFRIELGEIEAALVRHPDVERAAVVAQEDERGRQRLVAYVVERGDEKPQRVAELRAHLGTVLPGYMVPSAIVVLTSFPLTPNGKLDRRALPAPEALSSETARVVTSPRTPIEQLVAEVWADVLETAAIGVDDNFFELGGNSLQAVQVVSRIGDSLDHYLTLRVLFERPTVAALGDYLAGVLVSEATGEDLDDLLAELDALAELEALGPRE